MKPSNVTSALLDLVGNMTYTVKNKELENGTILIKFDHNGEYLNVLIPKKDGVPIDDEALDDYLRSVVKMHYENHFFEAITEALFDFKFIRMETIGVYHNTVPHNTHEKEFKMNRLFMVGSIILQDPLKYSGVYFNGRQLPDTKDEIIEQVKKFFDSIVVESNLIEPVLIHYHEKIDELMKCKTIEDIKKVKW